MNNKMSCRDISCRTFQRGLSLVELMVAITLGLLLTGALISLLVSMSKTSREQFKAAQQIENGRYAIDLLSNDIRLAGFYGDFAKLPDISSFAAQPDPCAMIPEGSIAATTTDSPLAFYIQAYPAANLTTAASVPTSCQTWINSASIKAGSDIIVVKRLDTVPLLDTPAPATLPKSVGGQIYAQTTEAAMDIQYGADNADIDTTVTAKNAATVLVRKDFSQAVSGGTRPTVAAYIRKLHVDIYYVSPCSKGTGSDKRCSSSDDTVPTLKRLELSTSGGAPTMTVVPLVEGIEFLKASYGLDNNSPTDGSVDAYVTAPTTIADWQNIITVEIKLLARNTESTAGFSDAKSYDLGSGTYTPSGTDAKFKRHLFTQKIYLPNIGGRRET